jgi:hypothetical protein
MANRERGELSVQARDGITYTFALGLNAQCEIEDRLSTPDRPVRFQDFIKEELDAHRIRLIFWAASRRHHPELSEQDIGAVVDEAFVGIVDVMGAVNRLIDVGMPTAADVQAAQVPGTGARPRKAQINGRGTGGASTSRPGGSV